MSDRFAHPHPGHESWRHKVRRPDGVVVLASGGLDSCVLVAHMARRRRTVYPLFVKAGMVWENAELAALRRFLQALPEPLARRVAPLKVVSSGLGGLYGSHWSTTGQGVPSWNATDDSVYLPGRNIMLISAAAVHAALLGVPRVALGPLQGNPFPDSSRAFFSAMRRAVSQGLDFPIRLEAPFMRMDKEQVIRLGEDLPLDLTFSCSRPRGGRACRRCAKCRERILALKGASRTARRAAAR
ncbi:MAG: 7-cyano-7-deazaguanine synthase [Candidatus Polarisedimenticolia bacterium]